MAIKYFKSHRYGEGDLRTIIAADPDTKDRFDPRAVPAARLRYYEGFMYPNFDEHGRTTYRYDESKEGQSGEPPTTLFGVQPPKIYDLYANNTDTSSLKATVPTLLGHVLRNAQFLGTTPVSSDDLSEHSSRLASRAIKKGIVTGDPDNPTGKQTNEIGKGTNWYRFTTYDEDLSRMLPVDAQEESGMRKAGREALASMRPKKKKKNTKPTPSGPAYEQLQMDV